MRRRWEDEIQRALIEQLRARGARGIVFWHHPAGGYRSKIEAAIMRGLGTRAGLPDIFIVRDGHLYGLELKHDKGRLSPTQAQTLRELADAGASVTTAYGLDEALAWLTDHGLLRGMLQ